jgi:Uma2 family endonuclease
MTQPLPYPKYLTIEEYLDLEQTSLEKHDYCDGELIAINQIIAMAGGMPMHSLTIANTIGELRNRIKGGPCRVFDSNLRIGILNKTRLMYPDISVVCGELRYDPRDKHLTTVTNPRVIIEVLSPGTDEYNRAEKFDRYREIDSFEEYILISYSTPRVESYRRHEDGSWLFNVFFGMDAAAKIGSLGIEVPLKEIYAGVEFPKRPTPPDEEEPAAKP